VAGSPAAQSHRDARLSERGKRLVALLCALLVVLPIQAATAPEARAATPDPLLSRPRVGEFQPVRGDNFLAWQQNTRSNPDQYDVYARPLGGGEKFKVDPGGKNGANGDIDGDVLVYQHFGARRSQLRFFDLVGRDRSNPPPGVNTPQWEYWPSMSGQWLLFGRLYDNGVRRIILFDLSTGTSRRLDKVEGDGSFLAPGQVSGDYAVWHTCRSATECDVVRYHISDATKTEIPNRGNRSQHSPSVTPDGTVYYARSGGECGEGVRLLRRPLEGGPSVLWRLPNGDDVGSTKTYVDSQGVATLLYDHFACGRPAASDAYQIIEDLSPELSVTLEGDGAGTVTSSPAGIDCGSDCTETYDLGTGVTLTAEPKGDAAFAGWSGACTGTSTTCTLTMDGPKSVTATFTNKPVLTVSKLGNGTGTVTSSPVGINCGTDCNEPYAQGTSVTLTATPDSDSTFGGWTGACGGSNLTCSVTMDASKSVTATFTLEQHDLQVEVVGDGTVTNDPAGTACGAGCARYDSGTVVTLTAQPGATANSVEWSGDCSSTELTCVVTMDADKSVTATFTLVV